MNTPKIVLASASPRRRELLALTGWTFRVHSVDIDETRRPAEHSNDYVLRLAQEKAQAALPYVDNDEFILASDTIVAMNDEIFGKPRDADHARQILITLRDRVHTVDTAVAVLNPKTGECHIELAVVPVRMRNYSDEEIEAYIESGDPFDKAGAYAIQNGQFHPVEKFSSCFASVMGLPLCHVMRAFHAHQLPVPDQLPVNCQLYLSYICPVHRDIFPRND
ncbi:MAG: septum formation protein Maf [Anaerolineaceae bacterium]|nr:septum formation protein Maf [Anaerolineaceae bacterium]